MKAITTLLLTLALVAGISFSGAAEAALINVDFGDRIEVQNSGGPVIPMSGAAVIGSDGDLWNVAATTSASGTSIPLSDSLGNSTSVTMSYSANSIQRVYGGTLWNYLMNDAIITSSTVGNSLSVTLSGIAPGLYDLYVYGGSTNGNDKTIQLSAKVDTQSVGSVTLETTGWEAAYVKDTNWHCFRNVAVGSSDELIITGVNQEAGKTAALNGFQLLQVPEPATLVFLLTGVLGLFGWPRRQRR